jgi:Transposase DDE domain group 1
MQRICRRPVLGVTTGGRGVVAHAGARLLCDLADGLGLTAGLSAAMAPTKRRRRGHDRGQVLADLAVAIADGATTITDLRVLANQPSLFGEVASVSTAWRALESVDDAALRRIAAARAEARRAAWEAGMDPGFYVIDIDGTLVGSHSEKQGAAPNYKHGFGFYPLMAYLDATGEALAGLLRPGNAGSGTAADHVEILDAALFQLPVDPADTEIIARTDSAGCSHGFLDACRARHVRFFTGHNLTEPIAARTATGPRWPRSPTWSSYRAGRTAPG